MVWYSGGRCESAATGVPEVLLHREGKRCSVMGGTGIGRNHHWITAGGRSRAVATGIIATITGAVIAASSAGAAATAAEEQDEQHQGNNCQRPPAELAPTVRRTQSG